MRKVAVVLAATTAALVLSAAAGAQSGGVAIVHDDFSPIFLLNPILPGDPTDLLVTTAQSVEQGANATVTLTGLKSAGLTFVGNGDASASCTSPDGGDTLTCSYTDFAHDFKSDAYHFASDPGQPLGTYAVGIAVNVEGVGGDSASADLTYGSPSSPSVPVRQENGMRLCYSVGGNFYTTATSAETDALIASGYWAPTATGFNPDGTPILECLTPDASGFENAPIADSYTNNIGDRFGFEQASIGDYPVAP